MNKLLPVARFYWRFIMATALVAFIATLIAVDVEAYADDNTNLTIGATSEGSGLDDGQDMLVINVVSDYNADPSGNEDSRLKFKAALERAIGRSETTKVVVPEGTYYLSEMVYIYPNTILEVDENATIIGGHLGSMIKGAHLSDDGARCPEEDGGTCTHGGYSQVHDVVIRGGTWDVKCDVYPSNNSQAFLFRHCKNITIENLKIKNFTNHAINISGVDGATVRNVVFQDAIKYTGNDLAFWADDFSDGRFQYLEALHFDFMSAEAESSGFPQDGTPCKNIVVENCTFSNVYSGVGTHHANNQRASNISVKNCTFDLKKPDAVQNSAEKGLLGGNALNYKSVDGIVFSGNVVMNCKSAVALEYATGIVLNGNTVLNTGVNTVDSAAATACAFNILNLSQANSIDGNRIGFSETGNGQGSTGLCVGNGVYLKNNSKALHISENTFKNVSMAAICLESGSEAEAARNTVTGAGRNGMVAIGSNLQIKDNVITGAKQNGIYIANANKTCVVSGNKIERATLHGLCISSGTIVEASKLNISEALADRRV